jgi:hypothetical protein
MAKRKPKGGDFQEFNVEPIDPLETTQPKRKKPRPRWVNALFLLIALGFCAYSASLNRSDPAAPVSDTTLAPTVAMRSLVQVPTETETPTATIEPTATLQPTLPLPTSTVMVVQPQLVIATNTVVVAFTPEPGLMMTVSPAQTFYAGTGGTNLRTCPDTDCMAVVKLDTAAPIQVDAYVNGRALDAGNAVWYRTGYNGQVVYAYSGVVQAQPPAAPVTGGGSTGQSVVPVQSQPQQTWSCSGNIYNCGDFSTCTEVTSYFNACPGDPSELDDDDDNLPCESLCK